MRYSFRVASVIAFVFWGAILHAQERNANATASAWPQQAPTFANVKKVDPTDSAKSFKIPCSAHVPYNTRLNFGGKFRYFAHQTVGPGAFIAPLFTAGPEMGKPPAHYPNRWREGPSAFSRLYGDALAFQTAGEAGRFLTGAALHEDPRYSRATSRKPLARVMHAVASTVFDKSDSGGTTLALSNFAGAFSAGFMGNAYLPHGYNDTSHAVTRTGIAFGSFAVTNLAVEFSPELRRIGRSLHLPKFMVSGQPEE